MLTYPPFLCNGGFPCVIFQKIMQTNENTMEQKNWKIGGLPPPFSVHRSLKGPPGKKNPLFAPFIFFNFIPSVHCKALPCNVPRGALQRPSLGHVETT